MRKIYSISFLISLLTFVFMADASAQLALGFNYNHTKPLQEYNDNLQKDPKGLSVNLLYQPAKLKNVYVGVEFGVSMYANDNYFLELSDAEGNLVDVEIDEEDCYFSYNALLRYAPVENGFIKPYLESRVGAVSFFSTSLAEEGFADLYDSETTFHGTAFNLGLGGGFVISMLDNLSLDLNATFNRGQHTFYRSIEEGDASFRRSLDYGKHESKTNNLNFKIGILFGF